MIISMTFPSFQRRGLRGAPLSAGFPRLLRSSVPPSAGVVLKVRSGEAPTRTSVPLPSRGVPRRGEGCNRSVTVFLERTPESHPPSLRDTSLKGGGIVSSPYKGGDEGEAPTRTSQSLRGVRQLTPLLAGQRQLVSFYEPQEVK